MDRFELARKLGAEICAGEKRVEPVVVEQSDQLAFMSEFAGAVAGDGPVFLTDPNWGERERAQLSALVNTAPELTSDISSTERTVSSRGWLCIPSGGSSGALKFARHDEETISAAVRGFCTHFRVTRVNAIGLLPLYHVSGLMAWMRCALTGGNYFPADWKTILSGERPTIAADEDWVISLVPTQLQRLLETSAAVAWLRNFRVIFVGGGPIWPELAERAAFAGLRLSLSYGMTETAAMIAALQPAEFFAGQRSAGKALPHIRVTLSSDGLVHVAGESLFRGYWPDVRTTPDFETADLGRFDADGNLFILGRNDAVIISGGEKISPLEVELALRAIGTFSDVAVVGVPSQKWGQLVVACYPFTDLALDERKLNDQLSTLATYKRPKHFVPITPWPRNAQGKVNRPELVRLASEKIAAES